MSEPGTASVLVVDDNPHNLRSTAALLADLDADIVCARSGAEALRLLMGSREFALALVDVDMPGIDGFATVELMRKRRSLAGMPVIFITAFEYVEDQVVRGYSLGAVDFIFKPIVAEILRSKVTVFLDLFRQRREIAWQAERLREKELEEAHQQWETAQLSLKMENEKRISAMLAARAEELAASVREREAAEERLKAANERLRVLANTAEQLLFDPQPAQNISTIFENLSSHLEVDVWLAYLLEDECWLTLHSQRGLRSEVLEEFQRMPVGDSIAGRAVAERRVIRAEDLGDMTARPRDSYGLRACVGFPIVAGERVFGSVVFGTRSRSSFENDELFTLGLVCEQVATALERTRLMGELESHAQQLREADRRKDEFLAMLAHELRNPLAPLVSATEVLRLQASHLPEVAQPLDVARRQLRHMVRLVDDLLDVSRITRGKVRLSIEQVALRRLVEEVLQSVTAAIEAKSHRLHVELPDAPVMVEVDPVRIVQIIGNLLGNAIRYTRPGGEIHLRCAVVDRELTITVCDNGAGIPPAMLDQVFDTFVQADTGASRSSGGLGLGLALVRTLTGLHGGTVAAHSAGPGTGSEFVVRLPVVIEPATGIRASQPSVPGNT